MSALSRLTAGGVAAALTVSLLGACAPADNDDPTATTITFAVELLDSVDAYDPAQGARLTFVGSLLFDVLAVWRPTLGEFEPRLAETLTISEDRRTLVIKLREDVDFIDGVHLDAAAVETYLDNLMASTEYIFAGDVAPYEPEFTATDEYTLELTTSKPIYIPDFLALFGETPILSPGAVEDPAAAMAEPMGTSPYLIEGGVTDVEMTFVRNPDYWNLDAFPYDTVVLKVLIDPVARFNALKSGQVDAAPVPAEYLEAAKSEGLTLTEAPSYFPILWVRDPVASTLEPLRDPRVRRAIMLSLDRETITETIYRGYGRVTCQTFSPGQAEYIENGDDDCVYDVDRARELLSEAGYSEGFDVVIPSYAGTAPLEPILQQSLGDIGIRVTFEQFPGEGEWFIASLSGEYPLLIESQFSSIWSLRYLLDDYPGYGRPFAPNDHVSDLIATIKGADTEASAAASQEFGEMLLRDAWYIPIAMPSRVWGTSPSVVLNADPTEVTLPDYSVVRDFVPAD